MSVSTHDQQSADADDEVEVDDQSADDSSPEGQPDDNGTDGDDESEDSGEARLGDAGKQALDRMKTKWRAERDARRDAERRLTEAPTKDDADAEQYTREAEAIAKANQRILRSEIKAAAKGALADPADAFRFLDLTDFEVDDDGNVDEDEIAEAISSLVEKKPYLAAQGDRRFRGGADGGARKDARPKQWTRADLAGKTPQQITDAKAKGQLSDLLTNPK